MFNKPALFGILFLFIWDFVLEDMQKLRNSLSTLEMGL